MLSSPKILRKALLVGVLLSGVSFFQSRAQTVGSSDCSTLATALNDKKFNEAFRLAVTLDGVGCEQPIWRTLSAEAFVRTGRFDEGLDKIKGIESSKADSLRSYVNRIRKNKNADLGHAVVLSAISDTSVNELLSLGMDGHLIVLKGKKRSISEFPIERRYDNLYRMSEDQGRRNNDPLVEAFRNLPDKGVFQLGPGCVLRDTSILVTGEAHGSLAKSSSSGLTIFRLNTKDKEKPRIFDLAEPGYIYAHPTLSDDGGILVISSDRPGGYGGMDLWMSKLSSEGPSELINLGPAVNSPYNELFPVFNGDTLYFASDDITRSIGGYDLFKSVLPYDEVSNPGQPLNTSYDDLCPVVTEGRLSHFISNRSSSRDLDDVFEVKPVKSRDVFEIMYGRIDADGLKKGTEVQLVNSDGVVLDRAYLDEDGNFSFIQVKGRETYQVILPHDSLKAGDELSIFDADKNLVKQVRSKGGKGFLFELLTPMDYLLEKEVNRDESMLTIDILGMMETGDDKVHGFRIILQDKEGNVVGKTFTDTVGGFKFENVSPDTRYTILTEVTDPNALIRIYNDRGELLTTIEPTRAGEFVYVRLKDDEKMITITNEERKRITISDKDLFNLPAIYYELGHAKLTSQSAQTLDKLIGIMRDNPHISIDLSGHTDSRGSAEYNLLLSDRRIQSVVDYLVEDGISRSRLDGHGYGESQLLNHCTDGVECSEEQHAVNRRTEIRIIDKAN